MKIRLTWRYKKRTVIVCVDALDRAYPEFFLRLPV